MYTVTALHNTGHGQVASTVLVSEDLRLSIDTAMNIEDLGYQFYEPETYVIVSNLLISKPLAKREDLAVFSRVRTREGWREEWYVAHQKAAYERVCSMV